MQEGDGRQGNKAPARLVGRICLRDLKLWGLPCVLFWCFCALGCLLPSHSGVQCHSIDILRYYHRWVCGFWLNRFFRSFNFVSPFLGPFTYNFLLALPFLFSFRVPLGAV